MPRQRIELEPAYVLHARPYSDTSLLLEVFTAHHGRIALIAKGARAPKSRKRVLLQVLQPLLLSWIESGELGTLSGVEAAAPAIALQGDALFCAWYANELLVKLLTRHDPHTTLFAVYTALLTRLAQDAEAALRQFECQLLDELGYGLPLERDIEPDSRHVFERGMGLRRASADEPWDCTGRTLIALRQDRLDAPELKAEARQLLRRALAERLGDRPLETATLLKSLRSLDSRA